MIPPVRLPLSDDDVAPAVSRLAPLRGADHEAVLRRALEARTAGLVPLVGDERWSVAQWQAGVGHAEALLAELTARAPDRAARIGWAAFTSGTTGRPRVILRTADSWRTGHRLVEDWLGLEPGESLLVPVHPVSSMAVNAADLCAHVGARLLVPSRARLRAADVTGGSAAVHCTPAQLADLCDLLAAVRAASAPAGPRVVLVGGDRLPGQLRERAAALGLRVVHYYGSAEASFVAVDPDGSGLRALPGVRLEIREGVLHVRSDQLAEPDGTRLTDGTPRWGADGWLCTGDRAQIDDDGVLHLRGRADDAILTGGATVIPAEVEAELLRATVRRESTASGGDSAPHAVPVCTAVLVQGEPAPRLGSLVVAHVEPAPGLPADVVLAALKEHARTHLPPAARPRRWQVVDRLERTGSGKIRRMAPDVAAFPDPPGGSA